VSFKPPADGIVVDVLPAAQLLEGWFPNFPWRLPHNHRVSKLYSLLVFGLEYMQVRQPCFSHVHGEVEAMLEPLCDLRHALTVWVNFDWVDLYDV